MCRFLSLEEILAVHESQIELFGGSTGIRDMGLLASALAMPEASFGGQYLHGNIFEKTAAYLFHVVSNHPFIDGNKRTGMVAALTFLDLNGLELEEGIDDDLENLVLSVAQSEADKATNAVFFRKHCVAVKSEQSG
ncbi:death-on-curing protein [Planctomycetales bacterium]|nr:death-on-curing protein [Planctomycetales bacterium]